MPCTLISCQLQYKSPPVLFKGKVISQVLEHYWAWVMCQHNTAHKKHGKDLTKWERGGEVERRGREEGGVEREEGGGEREEGGGERMGRDEGERESEVERWGKPLNFTAEGTKPYQCRIMQA